MLNGLKELFHMLSYFWHHKLITIAGIKLSFGNVLLALILLLFANRLSKMVSKIINKRLIHPFVPDKSAQLTYQTFVFYGCLGGFITLSLTIAGVPLTIFTVVGGALAIGVGFGSQNIVNNFISGVILLFEQPIKVGDVVELDNISGTVLSIGTRSTKIKNPENKVFIVPNSFFLEKSVLNWSFSTTKIRTTIDVGVAYNSDVKLVKKICQDILSAQKTIETHPAPQVLLEEFGESTINFKLIFWADIDHDLTLPEVRSAIRFELNEKFKQNAIEMAFPQRDVNFKLDRALEVKVLST